MRLSNIAITLVKTPAAEGPPTQGPTLDLIFTTNNYFVYQYGALDPSLSLDFVMQQYQSE
jgi:hypothetical protein